MDANGSRSFGLSWMRGLYGQRLRPAGREPVLTVEAAAGHRIEGVQLASLAPGLELREVPNTPAQIAMPPSIALDAVGNYVAADAMRTGLYSVSHLASREPSLRPVPVAVPAASTPVRDLAFGADDVLYVAGGAEAPGVLLLDTRARFAPAAVAANPALPAFQADRLAALPDGGVLALDRVRKRIARIHGSPCYQRGVDVTQAADRRFQAVEANEHPLTLELLAAAFPAEEDAIGIAVSDRGVTVVLSVVAGVGARLRLLREDGQLAGALPLEGPKLPHTVGWLDDDHVALMMHGTARLPDRGTGLPADDPGRLDRDPGAFVYRLDAALRAAALARTATARTPLPARGEYYPLRSPLPGPFAVKPPRAARLAGDPRLAYARPTSFGIPEPVPLARVSLTTRARYGVVANFPDGEVAGVLVRNAVGVLDTRDATTVWHRLYAEAHVPAGCAVLVWLSAGDGGPPPFTTDPDFAQAGARDGWFPMLIGDASALPPELSGRLPHDLPRCAWVHEPSEVPLGESLLACDSEPGVSGLFTALIQRPDRVVRTLRGRRLWLAAELFGNGRASPQLVTVRCYATRLSYRDRYLPALYREQIAGAEADRKGHATGADFLERFVHLFEGVFTGIEDRIAAAHLFTDPRACPCGSLPWLGSWIGMALEPGLAPQRARAMIANAPFLARRHGTLAGMTGALDIATDGAVTRGRIVVVEDFRLRRTLATILGAQLADTADPLIAGIARSGNSFIGDTLFLGDEDAKTFLALFRTLDPDPAAAAPEARRQRDEREAAIHALYDGLAYRVTVLVHDASADELRQVLRIAETAAPAHVRVRVVAARYPFLVAVASLVGADSYLRAAERSRPVEVDRSRLGYVDTLQGLGTLDAIPGSVAPASARPIADAGPDQRHLVGEAFTLDGSRSRAAPGRTLTNFTWKWSPQDGDPPA
jgi:phage tail-like protein